jgi:hypothetical protein
MLQHMKSSLATQSTQTKKTTTIKGGNTVKPSAAGACVLHHGLHNRSNDQEGKMQQCLGVTGSAMQFW